MNEEFIAEIYKNYLKLVTVVVRRQIFSPPTRVNWDGIEQCVSEVFVRAMEKEDLEKHPCVHKWLSLTAKHVTLSYNYKYKKDQSYLIPLEDNDKLSLRFTQKVLNDMEYEKCINEINKALSKKERALFHLKFIEKLNNNEIAGIIYITPSSVNTESVRLKKKIKKIINEMFLFE